MALSDLEDLYRDVILDHYRQPRGRDPLADPTVAAEGKNPLCGDEVALELAVAEGRIAAISVRSRGCSISVASGSLLAEELPGHTLDEARALRDAFSRMLHGEATEADGDALGDLQALEGVKDFPVRIKCALLPWTTLDEAFGALPEPAAEESSP